METSFVTRRPLRVSVATALMVGVLSACSAAVDGLGLRPDVPEGAGVEGAPWPRLVDGPPPAQDAAAQIAVGDEVESDVVETAAALKAEALSMRATPIVRGDLQGEARRVRRRDAALDAADRAAALREGAAAEESAKDEADRLRRELEAELDAADAAAEENGSDAEVEAVRLGAEADGDAGVSAEERAEAERLRAQFEAELSGDGAQAGGDAAPAAEPAAAPE